MTLFKFDHFIHNDEIELTMIKLKDILYLCQIKDDLERSDYSLLWVMSQ